MSKITSSVTTLGKLLRGAAHFTVPPFQRNYMWDSAEYSAFWDDIWSALATDNPEYLIGFLVLNPEGGDTFKVIDGQQRLTTTLILLSALRAHFLEANKKAKARKIDTSFMTSSGGLFGQNRSRLVLNFQDRSFFQDNILSRQPSEHLKAEAENLAQPPSNQGIAKCYVYMHDKIAELMKDGLNIDDIGNRLLNGFRDHVSVIKINVPDDINAFQIFEALNQRGMILTEDSLIKNHIYQQANGERAEVQRNWENMEESLEALAPSKFIAYHWQATQRRITDPHGLLFDIKRRVTSPKAAADYTKELGNASRMFAALWEPDHSFWASVYPGQFDEIRAQISFMRRMRAEQLMIVLLAALENDNGNFVDILNLMCVFTFRFTTICGRPPSKLLTIYIRAARALRGGKGKVTADQLFDQFLAKVYPSDAEFEKSFITKSIPRNAVLARHILAELNADMNGAPTSDSHLDPKLIDLEHILPIKFSEFWSASPEDFPGGPERYRHRLGNMTLINAQLNKELGNSDFATKKKAYAEDCWAITRDILSADVWGAEQIDARQQQMAKRASKIWRFSVA